MKQVAFILRLVLSVAAAVLATESLLGGHYVACAVQVVLGGYINPLSDIESTAVDRSRSL